MLTYAYRVDKNVDHPAAICVVRAQDKNKAMILVAVELKRAGRPEKVTRDAIMDMPIGSFARLLST